MVSYGNTAEYSAAYKLFHLFWLCHVPRNEMMDENDFEYYGIAMSGNRDWDERMATTPEITSITCAEMAQLIKDGVPLSLADPADAIKIYCLIMQHLKDWRNALDNTELYSITVPLEGLEEFNQLASCLLPMARSQGIIKLDVPLPGDEKPQYSRGFSSRTLRPIQAKDVNHSDKIFGEICESASRTGQSITWKRTERAPDGNRYGQ